MKRTLRTLALILTCMLLATVAAAGETDISQAKTIADLAGAKIAAQVGTFHLDALDQIEGVVKLSYPDFTDLLNALRSGAIDGYVAEEPTAFSTCGKDDTLTFLPFVNNDTGFTTKDSDTGIAVAFKTDSEMVAPINEIIADIPQETRSALMGQMVQLAQQVEATAGLPEESEEALALEIIEPEETTGTLKIAMECAYDPFNWTQRNDANGAVPIQGQPGFFANGYDVQIARYIAARLGMALEIYAYAWESLIPAVQAGTIDGIIAGMSPTEEREKEVDFTDCYYNSNLVVIIKK